jgi:hypothetical protein
MLCVVLLVTSVTSLVHAGDDHDPDCTLTGFVLHDASNHTIGASDTEQQEPPVHCLACHFGRSFRPRVETTYLSAPAIEAGARLLVEATPVSWASPTSQPPLRSPPVSL